MRILTGGVYFWPSVIFQNAFTSVNEIKEHLLGPNKYI